MARRTIGQVYIGDFYVSGFLIGPNDMVTYAPFALDPDRQGPARVVFEDGRTVGIQDAVYFPGVTDVFDGGSIAGENIQYAFAVLQLDENVGNERGFFGFNTGASWRPGAVNIAGFADLEFEQDLVEATYTFADQGIVEYITPVDGPGFAGGPIWTLNSEGGRIAIGMTFPDSGGRDIGLLWTPETIGAIHQARDLGLGGAQPPPTPAPPPQPAGSGLTGLTANIFYGNAFIPIGDNLVSAPVDAGVEFGRLPGAGGTYPDISVDITGDLVVITALETANLASFPDTPALTLVGPDPFAPNAFDLLTFTEIVRFDPAFVGDPASLISNNGFGFPGGGVIRAGEQIVLRYSYAGSTPPSPAPTPPPAPTPQPTGEGLTGLIARVTYDNPFVPGVTELTATVGAGVEFPRLEPDAGGPPISVDIDGDIVTITVLDAGRTGPAGNSPGFTLDGPFGAVPGPVFTEILRDDLATLTSPSLVPGGGIYIFPVGVEARPGDEVILRYAYDGGGAEVPDYVIEVAFLYEIGLGRQGNIDAAGLNFWIDAFESGLQFEALAFAFLESDEFEQRYGEPFETSAPDYLSDAQLVDVLYRNVLSRAPDPDGFAFWLGFLQQTDNRPGLLTAFATAPETRDNFTTDENLVETSPGFWEVV